MKYDIIVIGSGPGGYVAAIRAAQLGRSVAIIERAETGGVCLNWGCIPTKALLKSAQIFSYMNSAEHYGVELDQPARANMSKIVARSRAVADTMSRGVAFLLNKNKIELIQGSATLKSSGVVSVVLNGDGSTIEIEAGNIILATGARPKEMSFMPVDGVHIINSRQALTLERIPESMVVVGSGAIGCEFANLYAALGSKVTIIEYLPNIMPLEDEDVSRQMERSFRKMRIGVMTGASVKAVKVDLQTNRCKVEVEGKKGAETIECEVVLSAVGIKSNIENLGLEALGIMIERDKIVVDKHYQTSVNGVYAIGDIIASPALAHVASAEAICCVETICGHNPKPLDYSTVPSCIYTTPEVASVGLTEKEAIAQHFDIRIGKFPFTASGKATSAGDRDGFVKLIFEAETDTLLGAHMVGSNVTEMIAEPTIAKALGATAAQIISTIHPHPTMSEAMLEAAEAAHGTAIHL